MICLATAGSICKIDSFIGSGSGKRSLCPTAKTEAAIVVAASPNASLLLVLLATPNLFFAGGGK